MPIELEQLQIKPINSLTPHPAVAAAALTLRLELRIQLWEPLAMRCMKIKLLATMANKFHSNASQIAIDTRTDTRSLSLSLPLYRTYTAISGAGEWNRTRTASPLSFWESRLIANECVRVWVEKFSEFSRSHSIDQRPYPCPTLADSVWHPSESHVYFISALNSTQFEVFEVKQISGDINLISFCSGFCFMVLRVQVLHMCVCVYVYERGCRGLCYINGM